MSGIAGIVNLDGAPVDRALLSRMTDFLEFRGPDAKGIRTRENFGFGHTLLRTTPESEREEQPFTIDGETWIVADARVDGREELITKLRSAGRQAMIDQPDVELILHAYATWGQDCPEHLLGDFAFCIWDAARKRLFCVRDRFGIKPLYYAQCGATLVFSNTLDCVRLHPLVSNRLNDLAIADYLLFDSNQENDTTVFAEIRRIPPAHCATWTESGMQLRRYWELPVDEPLHLKKFDDYVSQFQELLQQAVKDRLRTKRVGVFMSGGLDSPALAATASALLGPSEVTAFTWVFDGIDQERHYAGLVAKHLNIPICYRDGNVEGVDPDWENGLAHTPQPPDNPMIVLREAAYYQAVSVRDRVVLYGEGPDAALHYEWNPYIRGLVRQRRFSRLTRSLWWHATSHRRIPLLPTIPKMIRERGLERQWASGYPSWLNRAFEKRFDLPARWADAHSRSPSDHPFRPVACAGLDRAGWQTFFEEMDAGSTGAPLEFRHPYFDVRLLRFLLSVPALPWCRTKYLIRHAMRGHLPDTVLKRPKAPLYPSPWSEITKRDGFHPLNAVEQIRTYVIPEQVPFGKTEHLADHREGLRPRRLNYWLKNAG